MLNKNEISRQSKRVPDRNYVCGKYDACLAFAAYSNRTRIPCDRCKNMSEAAKIGEIDQVPRVHKPRVMQHGCVGTVEAAQILGIPLQRLNYLRRKGTGPDYTQSGATCALIIYEIDALNRYMIACANVKPDEPTEVSTPAAAKIIGVSIGLLQKMRKEKVGPAWRQVGHRFLYSVKGLEVYKRGRCQSIAQPHIEKKRKI